VEPVLLVRRLVGEVVEQPDVNADPALRRYDDDLDVAFEQACDPATG
jgi:hypothetical protein